MEIPKKIGNYSIFGSLGKGGYGQVFAARNKQTLETAALKFSNERNSLKKEFKILQILQPNTGFIKVFEYKSCTEFDYFAMEMLERSLEYTSTDQLFPLKTIAAIGIEVLKKLETMHLKGIIHRDIKPSQFLLCNKNKNICIVDFGLATFLIKKKIHKEFKTRCKLKGSPAFASFNCHLGFRLSRRDDLEMLFYSLVYLLKGSLPWSVDSKIRGIKKWNAVLTLKVQNSKDLIYVDLPSEFQIFYKYVRRLSYDQTPNYQYLTSLLEKYAVAYPIFNNFQWIDHPEIMLKADTCAVLKNGNCVIRYKKNTWEYTAKRRNGGMNFLNKKTRGKSVSYADLQLLINKHLKQSSEIFGTSEEEKKVKNKNVIDRKIETKGKEEKRRNLTAEKIELNGALAIPKYIPNCTSFILPDLTSQNSEYVSNNVQKFVLENSRTFCDLKDSCDNSTARCSLPEFMDREKIISERKKFLEKASGSAEKRCLIY